MERTPLSTERCSARYPPGIPQQEDVQHRVIPAQAIVIGLRSEGGLHYVNFFSGRATPSSMSAKALSGNQRTWRISSSAEL
jgi:hypothetical protein